MNSAHTFLNSAYTNVFRRNSSWVGFMVLGAFVVEFFTDGITGGLWQMNNRGLQWVDLQKKLEVLKEEEEDE